MTALALELNPPVAASLVVGQMVLATNNTPPVGFLVCDGASLSTTTYSQLFSVLGYNYGGSGANFNLPTASAHPDGFYHLIYTGVQDNGY